MHIVFACVNDAAFRSLASTLCVYCQGPKLSQMKRYVHDVALHNEANTELKGICVAYMHYAYDSTHLTSALPLSPKILNPLLTSVLSF